MRNVFLIFVFSTLLIQQVASKKEQSSQLNGISITQELSNAFNEQFMDAIIWKGDVYALVKLDGWSLILVRFDRTDINKETGLSKLTKKDHFDVVNNEAHITKASLVVWHDRLYVFYKPDAGQNIKYINFDFEDDNKSFDSIKSYPKQTVSYSKDSSKVDNCHDQFETVVYNDRLYIGSVQYSGDNDGAIRLLSSNDIPDENGAIYFDPIQTWVSDGTTIQKDFLKGSDTRWDMQVWRGAIDTTNVAKPVADMVNVGTGELLVIGEITSTQIKAYTYHALDNSAGVWRKTSTLDVKTSAGENLDPYNLKLVQGDMAIEGDNTIPRNSLLFCYSDKKDDDVQIRRFTPTTNTFDAKVFHTGIDDGYMGVIADAISLNVVDSENTPYSRRIIRIISGFDTETPDCISILSNYMRIDRKVTPINEATLVRYPELRNLMHLEIIVEGPPPTPVCKQEDFDKIGGNVSSIGFSIESTETTGVNQTIDFKAVTTATLGSVTKSHASIGLGGHNNNSFTTENTLKYSYVNTFFISSPEDITRGYALFSQPDLIIQYERLCTPYDPEILIDNCPATMLMGVGNTTGLAVYPIDLTNKDLVGIDPTDFNSWEKRAFHNEMYSDSNQKSLALTLNRQINSNMMEELSQIKTVTNSTSNTRGFIFSTELALSCEVAGIKINTDQTFDFTESNSISLSKGFTATLYPLNKLGKNFQPNSFTTNLYLLNGSKDMNESSLESKYYSVLSKMPISPKMAAVPMRLDDEYPLVFAWISSGDSYELKSCTIGSNPLDVIPGNWEWRKFMPEQSGTLVASIEGKIEVDKEIAPLLRLRVGEGETEKLATSTYNPLTNTTSVSLEIEKGKEVRVGLFLFAKLLDNNEWILTFDKATANEEIAASRFNVRTENGVLRIYWPEDNAALLNVSIFNTGGVLVHNGSHTADATMTIPALTTGTYVVTASDGKKTRSRLVVLK